MKILYNKRDSALIQFKEPQQAQNGRYCKCDYSQQYFTFFLFLAVNHLHGAMLYGKKIHVVLSKHSQVQMPQAGSNVSCFQLVATVCVHKLVCNSRLNAFGFRIEVWLN